MTAFAVLPFLVLAADPPKPAFIARVVRIADGDTLSVLLAGQQYGIRLRHIDAPELRQAFGTRAKQALAAKLAGKDVRVEWRARDRYGRILGDAADVKVSAEPVAGFSLIRIVRLWQICHNLFRPSFPGRLAASLFSILRFLDIFRGSLTCRQMPTV